MHVVAKTIKEAHNVDLVQLTKKFLDDNTLIQTYIANETGLDETSTLAGAQSSGKISQSCWALCMRSTRTSQR